MNSTPLIRTYSSADKIQLMDLMRLNTPNYFAESEILDLDHYLDHELELYYVVELNSVLVGGGGINFDNSQKQAKISWDIIHPDFQGQGIGKRLLEYRLEIIKKIDDIDQIIVRTSQLTTGFYQKNGFELLEIKKDYWAKGFDLYRMEYQFRKV
jgi:ribosomal protein S18 acetylase RimI-like enzyme